MARIGCMRPWGQCWRGRRQAQVQGGGSQCELGGLGRRSASPLSPLPARGPPRSALLCPQRGDLERMPSIEEARRPGAAMRRARRRELDVAGPAPGMMSPRMSPQCGRCAEQNVRRETNSMEGVSRAGASPPGPRKSAQKSVGGSGAQRRRRSEARLSEARDLYPGGQSSVEEEPAVLRSEGELAESEDERLP